MRLSHLPLRVVSGAFILNSGLNKRSVDGQTAEGMHGMASNAIPQVAKVPPPTFASALSNGEIALGAALLAPWVSPVVVGAALTGFAAGLTQLYLKTPGMRQPGSIRPTEDGLGLAKDVWLLGIGVALLTDGLIDGTKSVASGIAEGVTGAASSVADVVVPGR